jgi:hypothetical protein
MLRERELAEVTKAVHWATLRQPATVLTTAFPHERSATKPKVSLPRDFRNHEEAAISAVGLGRSATAAPRLWPTGAAATASWLRRRRTTSLAHDQAALVAFRTGRFVDDHSLDETLTVRDREVVPVPRGYHPVGAPPGYRSYYLNVMAGPTRTWVFHTTPTTNG